MMRDIVILPGIGGSGESHWQTHWESGHPGMRRFAPASWDVPDLADWIAALDRAIEACTAPPVLVAHSLACLLVAHWRLASGRRIAGAFLVAVPDPRSEAFPREAASFADPPRQAFDVPSLIVASANDPYATPDYARRRAAEWAAGLIELGALGHINGGSGLGPWREGLDLLTAFTAGLGRAA